MRRTLVLLSLSLMLSTARAEPVTGLPAPMVRVQESGSTLVLEVDYLAPVGPEMAWLVLIDFDHMADFLPGVRKSRVVKREDNRMLVEQRGVMNFGRFGLGYASTREIQLQPTSHIHAHSLGGSVHIDSDTSLRPDKDGTHVSYRGVALSDFPGGIELAQASLGNHLRDQAQAMIDEMTRRAKPATRP